ncbi:unnamed protein product [Periconia digitata]|uniref:Uncharacterized protein n=1 Tax=Periconia digitata TaxID=1303443 RepID=A0A9W4USL2_9PLEO|nr:unnamed protein product [Periconia digitata]
MYCTILPTQARPHNLFLGRLHYTTLPISHPLQSNRKTRAKEQIQHSFLNLSM